jgi:hypothetical protein
MAGEDVGGLRSAHPPYKAVGRPARRSVAAFSTPKRSLVLLTTSSADAPVRPLPAVAQPAQLDGRRTFAPDFRAR